MTCIKTGADVRLLEYDCIVHGDLFLVGDVYILNCSTPWRSQRIWEHLASNLVMHSLEECGSRVLAAKSLNCGKFFYEATNE